MNIEETNFHDVCDTTYTYTPSSTLVESTHRVCYSAAGSMNEILIMTALFFGVLVTVIWLWQIKRVRSIKPITGVR